LCDEIISLPMFPEMTTEQVEHVAANVAEFLVKERVTEEVRTYA